MLKNITFDINRYEEGTSYYFNGVKTYKHTIIILAGISTIVLGLDFKGLVIPSLNMEYTAFSKNLALIIGAIIIVFTSLMTYWNMEKYWLTNKTIANKLRALRDEIENEYQAKFLDSAKIQLYFDKYSGIKETFSKYWEGAFSDRGSQNTK